MIPLLVNHTGVTSGAEVTTLGLLNGFPDGIDAVLACPEGPLAEQARAVGVPVVRIASMAGSLRLDRIETARAVGHLWRMGRVIRTLAGHVGADLIHATTVRAALATTLPPRPRIPVVASVHDCLPPRGLSDLTRRIVDSGVAAVIANSHHTARAWRATPAGPPLSVVHPSVNLARYRPGSERSAPRAAVRLDGIAPVLGVAAQITPWKGQDTAIRTLAGVRDRFPDARLLLVGEAKFLDRATRFDNRAYRASLERLVAELSLTSSIEFLGQREDMPTVLSRLDALLVPSWEEPFGLVIVEAMAVGTPVISTSVGGPREIITDGENGRLVPPDRPDLWLEAVLALLTDSAARERMIAAGLRTAQEFGGDRYVESVLGVYRSALDQGRRGGAIAALVDAATGH